MGLVYVLGHQEEQDSRELATLLAVAVGAAAEAAVGVVVGVAAVAERAVVATVAGTQRQGIEKAA